MIRTESVHTVPLIRLSSINPFLLELISREIDARPLLQQLGLPTQIPASSDLFVSALSIYELVESAARLAGDPYFGARLGANLDLSGWEPIAEAAESAGTVGELLNRFIVNLQKHASSIQYAIETVGNRCTFTSVRLAEPPSIPAQNDAFYLGFMSKLMRSATGHQWQPSSVLVTVSDPAVIPSEFQELRISKGGYRGVKFSFPAEWLFEKFEQSSFAVRAALPTNSYAPHSLVESVRIAVEPHIHEDDLTVGKAADLCGLEKRHLSRRLKNKGTTLAKEITRLREARASKALAETNTRIADIGMAIGFKDPTVFSRAFKNWTGQSPQAFRREHKTNTS